MTYASLTANKQSEGSIRRWVNWSQLDVETCLETAQSLIYSTLRVREMRSRFQLSVTAGDDSAPLPQYFLDPNGPVFTARNEKIELIHESELLAKRVYDEDTDDMVRGIPSNYAIFDEALQFDYQWDEDRTLFLMGYKSLPLLSGDNQSNFLCSRYPMLLQVAVLARGKDMMKEYEDRDRHLSDLTALIQRANVESDLSYRGANMVSRI